MQEMRLIHKSGNVVRGGALRMSVAKVCNCDVLDWPPRKEDPLEPKRESGGAEKLQECQSKQVFGSDIGRTCRCHHRALLGLRQPEDRSAHLTEGLRSSGRGKA